MMSAISNAKWSEINVKTIEHNEYRDCTVIALTVVTGLDYDVCHAQLKKQGRKNRKGCHWMIEGPKAAQALGFNMRRMMPSEYRAKTMITAETDPALRNGNYAVLVRGHVAGMIDGKVIDWSAGRRHKVQAVYHVTKITSTPAPRATRPSRELPKGSANWQAYRKYTKHDQIPLI